MPRRRQLIIRRLPLFLCSQLLRYNIRMRAHTRACARALLHNDINIKFYIIIIIVIMIVKCTLYVYIRYKCVCVYNIIMWDAVCRAHNGGTRARRRSDVRMCVCSRSSRRCVIGGRACSDGHTCPARR